MARLGRKGQQGKDIARIGLRGNEVKDGEIRQERIARTGQRGKDEEEMRNFLIKSQDGLDREDGEEDSTELARQLYQTFLDSLARILLLALFYILCILYKANTRIW